MDIFDILQNIKAWFTIIIGFKKSLKRKNENCEVIHNNKRLCLDTNAVKLNNEFEAEDTEINNCILPNILLKPTSPFILNDVHHHELNTFLNDITENINEENKIESVKSYNLPPILKRKKIRSMIKIASNPFNHNKSSHTSSIKGRNVDLLIKVFIL